MNHEGKPVSNEKLAALAAAYASINAKIEDLTTAKEAIRGQILAEASDFGTYPAGNLKVTVRHNRRLNAARFTERYPFREFPDVYKQTPDTAAAKQYIAPVELDECYDEGAPVVVVA